MRLKEEEEEEVITERVGGDDHKAKLKRGSLGSSNIHNHAYISTRIETEY